MSCSDKQISEVNSEIYKKGTKYELHILQTANERGFNVKDITNDKRYVLKDEHSNNTFKLDGLYGNWFIEITTSLGDSKMTKVSETLRLAKKQFSNCKTLVVTEKIKSPRKKDGFDNHYDYLLSKPWVDKVVVGEENFLNFLDSIKHKIKELEVPINKNNNNLAFNHLNKPNMNNLEVDLLRKFIDNGDLLYAVKTLSLMDDVGKVKTPKTKEQTKQSEYKKRRQDERKNLLFKNAKQLPKSHNIDGLIDIRRLFNKKSNTEIFDMKRSNIDDIIGTNSLYYEKLSKNRIVFYVNKHMYDQYMSYK